MGGCPGLVRQGGRAGVPLTVDWRAMARRGSRDVASRRGEQAATLGCPAAHS
jgi:hypothetical protein